MRFAGLLQNTVDSSRHPGLRVPGFQSSTALDFRTKPIDALCSALRAHLWGRAARRPYDWMRSPARAKRAA